MFIRFVVGGEADDHRWLTGIISEARLLRDREGLEAHEAAVLEAAYEWLNRYLPCPPFSTSGWSREAVTWFRDDAEDSIGKMWEIVALLKEHGIPVRMLRSKSPGKVLYEDKYQVVVEEWKMI